MKTAAYIVTAEYGIQQHSVSYNPKTRNFATEASTLGLRVGQDWPLLINLKNEETGGSRLFVLTREAEIVDGEVMGIYYESQCGANKFLIIND